MGTAAAIPTRPPAGIRLIAKQRRHVRAKTPTSRSFGTVRALHSLPRRSSRRFSSCTCCQSAVLAHRHHVLQQRVIHLMKGASSDGRSNRSLRPANSTSTGSQRGACRVDHGRSGLRWRLGLDHRRHPAESRGRDPGGHSRASPRSTCTTRCWRTKTATSS